MELMDRDEAVARLAGYHERLLVLEGDAARFIAAFRESPSGIGVHEIDNDRVLRRVNPEELRLLGYTEGQMVGHPVTEFIVMEEAAQRAIDQKLKGERELKPFLRTFRRADGSAVPLMLMDRLLRDERGATTGIRTVLTEARFRD